MADKKLQKKWIEALEGGQYEQGQGLLRLEKIQYKENSCEIKNEFCCLGVLCDLDGITWDCDWDSADLSQTGRVVQKYNAGNHGRYTIDGLLREKVGLNSDDLSKVISMNDAGRSFKSIAKTLRKIFRRYS